MWMVEQLKVMFCPKSKSHMAVSVEWAEAAEQEWAVVVLNGIAGVTRNICCVPPGPGCAVLAHALFQIENTWRQTAPHCTSTAAQQSEPPVFIKERRLPCWWAAWGHGGWLLRRRSENKQGVSLRLLRLKASRTAFTFLLFFFTLLQFDAFRVWKAKSDGCTDASTSTGYWFWYHPCYVPILALTSV